MAWKGLHLTQAARLSLADNQVCVKQDAGEVRLALEDIAWIVIDTPQASLTSALMSACMEAGIALVFTDERHTPSRSCPAVSPPPPAGRGGEAPDRSEGRRQEAPVADASCARRSPIRPAALAALNHGDAATLKEIARHVEPDDPDNVEARAARFYWGRLFDDFVRDDAGDRRNKLLELRLCGGARRRRPRAGGLRLSARVRPQARRRGQRFQSRRRSRRTVPSLRRSSWRAKPAATARTRTANFRSTTAAPWRARCLSTPRSATARCRCWSRRRWRRRVSCARWKHEKASLLELPVLERAP